MKSTEIRLCDTDIVIKYINSPKTLFFFSLIK